MLGIDLFTTGFLLFWLAVLGSVMGSWLDCAAYRIIHKESLVKGRSHCGTCGHTLGVRDLVPIFSFLFHKGRCRFCGEKIPAECLVAELCGAAMFVSFGLRFDITLELLMYLICGCLFLLLSLIDWNTRLLPDLLLLLAVINRAVFFVVLWQFQWETVLSMAISAVGVSGALLVLVLLMDKVLGKETMGGGDIKLLFVMGLYLNWMEMLLLLCVGCILALIAICLRRGSKGTPIPFGPFLGMAWALVVLFGAPLITWYQSLFM